MRPSWRLAVERIGIVTGGLTIGTAFGTGLYADPVVVVAMLLLAFCLGIVAAGLDRVR